MSPQNKTQKKAVRGERRDKKSYKIHRKQFTKWQLPINNYFK